MKKYAYILCSLIGIMSPLRAHSEEANDYRSDSAENKESVKEINRLINDQFQKLAEGVNKNLAGKTELKECKIEPIKELGVEYLDRNFTRIGNKLRDFNSSFKISGDDTSYNIDVLGDRKKDRVIYEDTSVHGCCVTSVNIKGIVLGIDKIDHFFGNGALLYRESVKNPQLTDKDLISMNVNQENGMWGLSGNNIKSYGDLAANWQGVKFYKELFDGPNPYFKCKDGVLTASREFKIEDHVNIGWSEATNCPAFNSESDAKTFSRNLKKLKLTCPLDPNKCTELIGIYKDQPSLLSTVVSPVCRDKVPLEKSVEEPAGFAWNDIKNAATGLRAKEVIKFFNVTK